MKHTTANRRQRSLIALGVALAMATAACGSDDDAADDDEQTTVETSATEDGAGDEEDEGAGDGETTEDGEATEDSASEEEAAEGDDDGETIPSAPDWVQTPSAVRESGALGWDEGDDRYSELGAGCEERGLARTVSVYWPDHDDSSGQVVTVPNVSGGDDFTLVQDLELFTDPGLGEGDGVWDAVVFFDTGDASPVDVSQSLWAAGWFASPVYEMYPAPARMFFPGTLPIPAAAPPDPFVDETARNERPPIRVDVLDTGGADFGNFMPGDQDLYADDASLADNWVVGHGAFVAGVILESAPNAVIEHYRMPRPTGDSDPVPWSQFSELDLLAAAVTALMFDDPAGITNLSAGIGICQHGWSDSAPINAPSVVSAIATFNYLTADERILIAAAGNAGNSLDQASGTYDPNVITLPAAYASEAVFEALIPECDGSSEAEDQEQEDSDRVYIRDDNDEDVVCRSGPEIVTPNERILAVKANDKSGIEGEEESYTTEATWTTHDAPGCHTSWYPIRAEATYPAYGSADETSIEFSPRPDNWSFARWCGSSFATAAITAQIVNDRSES